jgi:alpha-beta hydrolase superfamily lysophospholipase
MSINLLHLQAERNPVAVLEYEPRRPRGVTIVAGHGYSSSKHNLDFLCSFLSSHGYRIFSLDFPGHKLGASGGRLRGIGDLIDAMSAVVNHALSQAEEPLYTMGHSMGAMTALFTAAADPRIAGLVAITTGFGRPSALRALQERGVTDFRASYVEGVSLPELMRDSEALFERALAQLAGRPQLYVGASRDAMVSRASVEELYDRASEPKTLRLIESDHTTAGDNARADVLQWLNALHPR